MKAKELRIGNYIYNKKGETEKVYTLKEAKTYLEYLKKTSKVVFETEL